MIRWGHLLIAWIGFLSLSPAHAGMFALPKHGDSVVGEIRTILSQPGDDFARIGRRYDVGYYGLVEANPQIPPDTVLPASTVVVIPSKFILPAAPMKGIVINLAELRLYYYVPGGKTVITHPVGIGREGWSTPVGVTTVIAKVRNPTWNVPEGIRKARAEEGVHLPKSVPPGFDNPLGGYALRLGFPAYLIHGTNDFTGVGRRSSSGCIRMLPEDIEDFFDEVPVGTRVQIVNAPIKAGIEHGQVYIESHVPVLDAKQAYHPDVLAEALIHKMTRGHRSDIDAARVIEIAQHQNGIPQIVGILKS